MTYFHIAKFKIFSFCSANSLSVCFDEKLRKMTQNPTATAISITYDESIIATLALLFLKIAECE